MSSIHDVWSRTRPTWTRSPMPAAPPAGRRCGPRPGRPPPPGRSGLADLVAQLADDQDLLHARGGVGHEVEGAGQRAQPGQQRQPELEAQVLLERRLGVHRHGPQAGRDLPLGEARRPGLERPGQVALGVHLAQQRALAAEAASAPSGGDRRLADTALAGDEQEPAVEQADGMVGRRGGGQPPKPMRRPFSLEPISM